MAEFVADVQDVKFALFEQVGVEKLLSYPKFRELDRETIETIIDEAYHFAKAQLAPVNAAADREGVRFDSVTCKVKVPAALREAYQLFTQNGWLGLTHDAQWGGQGMPYAVSIATNDFFFGACLSFCLGIMLTRGVADLIHSFGTDTQKRLYLQKLCSGQWSGTMCLTEAGAGSDVGAARTKAKRAGDHYLIEGEKIFITFGEHDLTENICHTVLARIEGAPAGTKGLSLFLVPKVKVNPDGSLGDPNDVKCTGIEHKMGIHASPTCTMLFGDKGQCHGYLLGEEHKGMRAMFQMMNEARISVGVQGMSLAGAAYQAALAFARERLQGKDALHARDEVAPSVPILRHPDVRQMLLWQKAIAEGTRALLLRTAFFYDIARASPDPEEREKYAGLVELLTPVCKAYCSDQGFRATELAIQTLGGYGYIQEYPVEQYLRDAKIASIYEGTNGIQALDLVTRKLSGKGGENLRALLGMMIDLLSKHAQHPALATDFVTLGQACEALADVSLHFAQVGLKDPLLPLSDATAYLDLFGQVTLGWLLVEQATLAYPQLEAIAKAKQVAVQDAKAMAKLCEDDERARFFDSKIKTAQFYARRSLPLCRAKADIIKSGDRTALDIHL